MNPIEATFEHGVFRPVSPVSLPEGSQVQISVVSQAPASVAGLEQARQTRIEDQLSRLANELSDEAWQQLPADLSDRIDHYVYQDGSQ